ncbi:hypothetical protein [Clostridium sartagoforme]|jgi:hypothetical protein|uniref:hypothetical protein n=1 Tax=Clostridium sartagoforme TaxID=84031 RepID=UPI0031E078E4
MKKNILFIAYHFPPIGGSGVQRSLKYVKYLPTLDFNPIVVTVKNGHNFAYDFSMLNEIPKDVKVYRSNSGEKLWLRSIIEKSNKILIKRKPKNIKYNSNILENKKVKNNTTVKDKIFKYLEYNYYIPDTKIRWYRHAIKDIRNRILKENEIDIIYSTSSPYTDHLIALEIKKQTKKKWVADFRDPWIGNDIIMGGYSKKRIEKEKRLECEVITLADVVINVTESITDMYVKRYPEFKDKFITITNGFDSNDKKNIKVIKNEKFQINYSGILISSQNPEDVIIALENIASRDDEFREDLEVNFTGNIDEEIKAKIRQSKLSDKININSYIEHDKILNVMANSNINLLILPNDEQSKGIYTGKIFDYILVERPILGIMPTDGVAAKLINTNNIGLATNHGDVVEIESFILSEYKKFKNGYNLNNNSITKCSQFDRVNLAKQLADVFDKLI